MLRRALLLALFAALLTSGCATDANSAREMASDRGVSAVPPTRASGAVPPLHPSIDDYPEATLQLVGRSGRTVTVAVKVANTAGRRRHGLMEVPALPDGVGMLFVFPADQSSERWRRRGFWMENTLVPLDVAFFGSDGVVDAILRMEPCASAPCPVYDPGIPYRYALEVPAGWFGQVGVDSDWRLELPADLPPSS
ncbi:MAG: DUF192 domain-containing protein [Actinomycetota bacterium]|nr:DUF192 domain-containing protein [Actinomycetota bacterium]